jgi:uncharacterized delta-60 repeat protein
MKKYILVSLFLALLINGKAQQLNTSFNNTGYVYTNIDNVNCVINGSKFLSAKLQTDNKIVLGGNVSDGHGTGTLLRVNNDGTPDASFGVNGFASIMAFSVNDISIQADGKIVACGNTYDGNNANAFGIERFNINGAIDSTFGTNGRVNYTIGYRRAFPSAIMVQTDGKILIVGTTDESNGAGSSNIRMGIMRLNADGSLDNSFDTVGKKVILIAGYISCDAYGVTTTQLDTKILIAGVATNAGIRKPAIVRLLADGNFDNSFDTDGALVENYSTNSFAKDITITSTGKILFCGDVYLPASFYFNSLLVQYNDDGSRDNSFGTNGVVIGSAFTNNCNVNRMVLLPSGKILVGGNYSGTTGRLGVMLFTNTGALDVSLNGTGYLETNYEANNFDVSYCLAAQADGKFFIAGNRSTNTSLDYFAVAKYNANGSRDISFNATGVLLPFVRGTRDDGSTIAIQADGKIIVAGEATKFLTTNNINFTIQRSTGVVRYNTNGTLDASFGTGGILQITPSFVPKSIALQTDGKIIITGTNLKTVRLNANGTMDNTFGSSGAFTHPAMGTGSFPIEGNGIAIQPDGKILISGYVNTNTSINKMSITRLNANGTLDATFAGGAGTREIINGQAKALALLSSGKILITGTGFYTLRLMPDATTDVTFTATSASFINVSNTEARSIKILNNGKIILGGVAVSSTSSVITSFALAKYNADGGVDATFGTNGVTASDFGYTSQKANKVILQNDGDIIAVGDGINLEKSKSIIVAKYTAAGLLNTSFGSSGVYIPDILNGAFESAEDAVQYNNIIFTGGAISNVSVKDFFVASINVNSTVLPLQFLSFTAQKCGNNNVCLIWKTANEQNVSHFEIERSVDGISYYKIGSMLALNQSSNSYSFTDNNLSTTVGKYYYRIKQIDTDLKFKYSSIALINQSSKAAISIYPNPTIDEVNIVGWNTIKQMQLLDITGKQLQQWNVVPSSINIGQFAKGTYVLKMNLKNGETVVQKINKL